MTNTQNRRFRFNLGESSPAAGHLPAAGSSGAVKSPQPQDDMGNNTESHYINGLDIRHCQPYYNPQDMIVIDGMENTHMSISREQLAKGLAFVGGSGTGKTNTLYQVVEQCIAQMQPEDKMVIVDSKGDYEEIFRKQGHHLMGSSDYYENVTDCWNIFAEIGELDQLGHPDHRERESNKALELCRGFFSDQAEGNTKFFNDAAAELMAGTMCYFMWQAYETGRIETLCNYSLIHLILQADVNTYLAIIDQYASELGSLRSYLVSGDGTSGEEGQGVLSTLNQMIKSLFMSKAFGRGDHNGISIRQFLRQKASPLLFIELDLAYVNSQAPLIRVLCNLVLQAGMSKSRGTGTVYLVIDEVALCGKVNLLSVATNFGRDLGQARTCTSIIGMQNLNQLVSIYGEHEAKSLLNYGNVIAYNNVDAETREWFTKRLGKAYELVTYQHQTTQVFHRESNVVNDWNIMKLGRGQAYVSLSEELPFLFHFAKFIPPNQRVSPNQC